MAFNRMFIICITFVFLAAPDSVRSQDALHKFIDIALINYGSWLNSSGYDPTPVDPTVITVVTERSGLNVTLNFWNQVVSGHSNYDMYSSGSLINGVCRAELSSEVALTARYNITGHVLNSIPVTGQGSLTLRRFGLGVIMEASKLRINAEGYVNLTEADVLVNAGMSWYTNGLELEGLSAGGFESEVATAVLQDFQWSSNERKWPPLPDYLLTYMTQKFDETPVADWVGLPTLTTPGWPTWPEETSAPGFGSTTTEGYDTTSSRPIDPSTSFATDGPGSTTEATPVCDSSSGAYGEIVVDSKEIRLADGRRAISITKNIICIV